MKLKVGMKVIAIANEDNYEITGLKGKIVTDWNGDLEYWGVEFDERFQGSHSLGGMLANGMGLWVEEKNLVPVNFRLENK